MAIKNREQIGWIDCPMCQTRGTVHASKIGRGGVKGVKFWRCQCGCIQPWAAAGQAFIEANMRPMEMMEAANDPAPEQQQEQQQAAGGTKRKAAGGWGMLRDFLSEDEE